MTPNIEQHRTQRGFALLIALTLMAFLVLLMLSLTHFANLETLAAQNTRYQTQARSNAMLALNIAIRELQKYTGPDQRTTARSDIDEVVNDSVNASHHWIGAYGNGGVADYAQIPSQITATMVDASDANSSQAKLLNWLVSGNEATNFNPANDVGANGNILNVPTNLQFEPGGIISGLTASSDALTDTITIADSNDNGMPARLLVGSQTVGNSVADYVVAPLVEIADTSDTLIGRYSWWVGDENIKARANLPIATGTQIDNAFFSSQRAAIELMDALNPSDSTTLLETDMLDPAGEDARYDPSSRILSRVTSTEQIPMLSTSASGALEKVSEYRYHDLSASSASVLSDTYAGGLKKDLSALLATGSTEPLDTDFIFPPESGSFNHVGVPTWGELRSFAQTTASSTGMMPRVPTMTSHPDTDAYPNNAPVATNVGVSPLMTYAAYGFRYIAPDGDAVGNRIGLAMVPIVVLWNPYTTTIRGLDGDGNPIRYEVGIRKAGLALIELQGRPESTGVPGSYTWSASDRLGTYDMGMDGTDRFFRFVIESPPGGIGPGESLIFTLDDNGQDYQTGTNILTNGLNDNYYVILPQFSTTITTALGQNAYYRVAVNGKEPEPKIRRFTPRTMWGNNNNNWGGRGRFA